MKAFENSTITIVEGDAQTLENLTGTIRSWGLGVKAFSRAETAFEHIRENGGDIVLLDVSRSWGCDPSMIPQLGNDLKIIATTLSTEKDIAIPALQFGAFDFLEKPFHEELLHHSLMRALEALGKERRSKRLREESEQSRSEMLDHQQRLENLNSQLFETNRALSVLARNIKREREEIESQIGLRLNNLLLPMITRLRNDRGLQKYSTQLDMLTWHLEELSSGLSFDPSFAMTLSSTEMRVASLVKTGARSEEIARQLHISGNTVRSHRRNIRKKLKVSRQNNLRNFLDSRSGDHRQATRGAPLSGLPVKERVSI
jgi:FixJ family two-component response regulator